MRWTQDQYDNYLAQARGPFARQTVEIEEPDTGPERKLQERIETYLKQEGFYFFHDRSRGANKAGQPDLVVALYEGRVLWLELKSKHGRLSPEQIMTRRMLLALGQEFYEIRSFKVFLNIIQKAR